MRVNIITNLTPGCGLWHDYNILAAKLGSLGHVPVGIDFQAIQAAPVIIDRYRADLNIFLEVVVPAMYRSAPCQWLVPNPEWWPDTDLTPFSRILCKTKTLFDTVAADPRARLVGFASRDLYNPTVERKRTFLHVAGKSEMKNTDAVLAAWRGLPYDLTVVTHWPAIAHKVKMANVPGVRLFFDAKDTELRQLMNEYRFHVCPSKTEGWGHYIHEALGVGACVIATDGPPMNTFEGLGFLVHAHAAGQLRRATLYDVNVEGLRAAVGLCAALPNIELDYIAAKARAAFQDEHASFRDNLRKTLAEGIW